MKNSEAPPRILIIDNDEGLVAALVTRLEHAGYECLTAASGSQGTSIFRESEVDLVITDLNMPNGNGISVITSIRDRSDVPVIAVTGFADEFQDDLRKLPRVTCLRKPFDTDALLDLVELETALARP